MKKKYTYEFKQEIVNQYKNGAKVIELYKTYGLPRSVIYDWIRLLEKQKDKNGNNFNNLDLKMLKKELSKIKEELEIIKKANCLPSSSREDKLKAIDNLYGIFPVKRMCRILNVHFATFYNYHFRRVKVKKQSIIEEYYKVAIKRIFSDSDGRFGTTKISHKMKSEGYKIASDTVSRLMKEMNLRSKQCKKKKIFVQERPLHNYYKNKLNRQFDQIEPNKFWVGDVTAIQVGKSFFYLCVIMDLFSRKIIAYRISSQNNTNLTINTFKDAYEYRNRPQGVGFHRDQGNNYTSMDYCALLRSLKVKQSYSKKANPYDNAVMEAFFSNIKREELNSNRFEFFDDLIEAVKKYIEHYNGYRPHDTLKGKTPNQIEREFFAELFI